MVEIGKEGVKEPCGTFGVFQYILLSISGTVTATVMIFGMYTWEMSFFYTPPGISILQVSLIIPSRS